MIHHHPEDATLISHAAGALPAAMALVVGCHLESCTRCRRVVAQAESIGGALIDSLEPQALKPQARRSILERLDVPEPTGVSPQPADLSDLPNPQLPKKLRQLLGTQALEQQRWRSAGPGVRLLKLDCGEGSAMLMDIAPNYRVPVHSHRGTELTLILDGAYDDALGHFAPGDVADLDHQIEHQPAAGPQGCLCLAGLDAPVRYKALLPRLLQPLFGL